MNVASPDDDRDRSFAAFAQDYRSAWEASGKPDRDDIGATLACAADEESVRPELHALWAFFRACWQRSDLPINWYTECAPRGEQEFHCDPLPGETEEFHHFCVRYTFVFAAAGEPDVATIAETLAAAYAGAPVDAPLEPLAAFMRECLADPRFVISWFTRYVPLTPEEAPAATLPPFLDDEDMFS